jgi:hypothetical protein
MASPQFRVIPMRVLMAGIVVCAPLAAIAAAPAAPAATKLTPQEIQSTFFTGEAFTSTTPSGGAKFKMVFTPDGKVTRTPVGKSGSKGEGSWKLDDNGFCNTWKSKTPNCFTVTSAGTNKWSVMNGATPAAVWSKQGAATPTPTRAPTNP